MSEYTSTREGFQRAMEWSLTGPPGDAKTYAEATTVPTFYHLFNNQRLDYDDYVDSLSQWRQKISDYKPKVEEFLRDGDQLAARMTGTIKVDKVNTFFESFLFGKIDNESGKIEYLIERSVWGEVGKEPEHGVN
ncbi:hypothetical protein ACHAPJ_009498 [Fusarium lateritium]